MADLGSIQFDSSSGTPLYKQLADAVSSYIADGRLRAGDRLPPTRELAIRLGLNRTTVSSAYALLEQGGLIEGQVGRGSFVAAGASSGGALPVISFASSRPSQHEFPLAEFRRLTKEVVDSESAAEILQLGSAHGYTALRRYLLEQAQAQGVARPTDGLLVTNGCQQGLDLLARVYGAGQTVALEDPTYHGSVRVFARAGAEIVSVPVREEGLAMDELRSVLERSRPRLLVLTPNFQNPTGTSLPLEHRRQVLELAHQHGCIVVENDIYGELRYRGERIPTLKELDPTGGVVLLGSYSKVSFPGLRVGWAIAPRTVIARLAEVKEISDLHSDQLSQAVLLRFAESGELAKHLARTRKAGAERLRAALQGCAAHLPSGSHWTKPDGGMNLWVELPRPLDAERLLEPAQRAGVTFTPGNMFATHRAHSNALRISFGSLSVPEIERGMKILGEVAGHELDRLQLAGDAANGDYEPAAALV